MNEFDFLHLFMRHQDGVLTADEITALEAVLRDDPTKRQLFAGTQIRSMALYDRFRQDAFRVEPALRGKNSWITRPMAAMAAGLVMGLFSASIVWAMSSPRATALKPSAYPHRSRCLVRTSTSHRPSSTYRHS